MPDISLIVPIAQNLGVTTDGIKKAIIVLKHAKNRDLIDRVHWALAWIYIHEKDYEKAREHIEVFPSVKSNRYIMFLKWRFANNQYVSAHYKSVTLQIVGKLVKTTCNTPDFCYNIIRKKAIATEWLTSIKRQKPSQTGQSTGKVFVMLVTYQINECQQCIAINCKEEHSERH